MGIVLNVQVSWRRIGILKPSGFYLTFHFWLLPQATGLRRLRLKKKKLQKK